ncbi:MAG: hypothetical protein A4E35_00996 [Methanoregula sp. PtaU1.Bin051]|nr:MAG: hypothetical protein A4E35_00996 [Methanoregula sp. PtaU1.Bin051]
MDMRKGKKPDFRDRYLISVVVFICLIQLIGAVGATMTGTAHAELRPASPPPPLLPGQSAATYPVGFYGLSFNADNRNMLELDLGAAQTVNAEVTSFPDRIEVYQHSSPAVLITFWGNAFEYSDGKIVGKVTRSDFVTSPLTSNITEGDVTGSIRVQLLALEGRADCRTMFDANATAGEESQFRDMATSQNLAYTSTAFTFNITKVNLAQTGTANLTFTVPAQWVSAHGGSENVYIARISEKDHSTQILNTSYLGLDPSGAMKFSAYSPDGTSLFGMITAKLQLEKGVEPSKGQIMTDIGILAYVAQTALGNIYVLGAGIVAVGGIVYFGWMRGKADR